MPTRTVPATPVDPNLRQAVVVSVPTAGRILGVGRNTAYQAARTGDIPAIHISGRLVVPVAALRRMLGEVLEMATTMETVNTPIRLDGQVAS